MKRLDLTFPALRCELVDFEENMKKIYNIQRAEINVNNTEREREREREKKKKAK